VFLSHQNLSITSNYENTHGGGAVDTHGGGAVDTPFSKWTKVSHLTFGGMHLTISDLGEPTNGKGGHLAELMPRIEELEKNFKRFTTKLLNFYGPYVVPEMLNPLLAALVTHTKNCTGKYPPPPTPTPGHGVIPTHGKIGPEATALTASALLLLLGVFGYLSRKGYEERGGADDTRGLGEGELVPSV
jgi:hypothetical protein